MGLLDRFRRPKGDMDLEKAMEYLGLDERNIRDLVEYEELVPASIDPLRFDRAELDDFSRRAAEQQETMKEFIRAGEAMHLDERVSRQ